VVQSDEGRRAHKLSCRSSLALTTRPTHYLVLIMSNVFVFPVRSLENNFLLASRNNRIKFNYNPDRSWLGEARESKLEVD
jgi:hypothetical protein